MIAGAYFESGQPSLEVGGAAHRTPVAHTYAMATSGDAARTRDADLVNCYYICTKERLETA
jgi:hypothetical protein